MRLSNELEVTLPDGFRVMEDSERDKLQMIADGPGFCAENKEAHIMFSAGWKKIRTFAGIILNRRNTIVLLMAIALMLLAVNINFVAFSHYLGNLHGQVFALFIMTVAATESVFGLAILVVLLRRKNSINVDERTEPKG